MAMPPPPPPQPVQVNGASHDSDDGGPPSPTVKENLRDVQLKLLTLEYTLRNLSAIAADVQPQGQNDHAQGRAAGKVQEVIEHLMELDVQKDRLTQNIPIDIIKGMDENTNPNRIAKERIENAAVQNQYSYGQILAIQSYRSILREALVENFPDLADQLDAPRGELVHWYSCAKRFGLKRTLGLVPVNRVTAGMIIVPYFLLDQPMSQFLERYKTLTTPAARISLLNAIAIAPPTAIDVHGRIELVNLLLEDLKDTSKFDPNVILSMLVALKTLGRNSLASEIISQKEHLQTLQTLALPSGEVPKEALRCIANALLLVEAGRSNWLTPIQRECSPDYLFLAARVLFLSTVFQSSFIVRAVESLGAVTVLANKLDALLVDLQHSRPMSKEAMVDALKYTFNLLLQYPRMKHAASGTDSGPSKPNDTEPKPVMGELWDERFAVLLPTLLHLFNSLPQTTGSPLAPPLTHVIHALLNIPIVPNAKVWFPDELQMSQGSQTLQKVRRSLSSRSSPPRSGASTPVAGPATEALRRAYDLLDATLAYFTPGDPDDLEVRAKCKREDVALDDVGPPLALLLANMVRDNEGARGQVKQWLLPVDLDRSQPLEKRADILGRCLRMMASVYFPKLKDSIGEMLFALCNSDANMMGAQLGYGNIAGFLFNKGIMAPPPPPKDSGGAAGDYIPDDPDINPITGSKYKPEGPDPLAGMTDEEKEREAEKLFVLFDRLEKMGMAVNPMRKAQQEGKLEELP
ncbi:hypothetical protein FRB96_009001 [Tulasnella sp. 330]|nr:hypothetical protein FRB96_009001 [Tulasnella sp. 330]